jgi:hypothetical protein
MPPEFQNQVRVVSVTLRWEDPAAMDALLDRALGARAALS